MITANAIQRTFHLRLANQAATGFVIDVDRRQYLITAKHFAGNIQNGQIMEVYYKDKWNPVQITLIGHAHDGIDISVLAVPYLLAHHDLTLPADMGGLIYGQDLFFLGFPYGLLGDAGGIMGDFPLPFVKNGVVSCFAKSPEGNDLIILDAINNYGFSGGPVIFKEANSANFKVASVVSGYRFNREPVYHENQATQYTIRENTGLVISYPIKYAIEIIRTNPIGTPMPC